MCAEYNTKLERMRALIERLTEADVAYFKNDEPIMSDWEYDQLTDELASLEHDNLISRQVLIYKYSALVSRVTATRLLKMGRKMQWTSLL